MTARERIACTGAVPAPGDRAVADAVAAGWRGSPRAVAATVLLVYALWITAFLGSGHDIRDCIDLGRQFITQSHASAAIRLDPSYRLPDPKGVGFDGQFYYYLAVDPVNARFYMDWPAYRYGRILYPMLARLLALAQPALIPYTLVLINWLAAAGGTLALAAWLKRKGLSPWLALIYAFSGGVFLGLRLDLTEPLALALVALAIYLYDFGGRRRLLWAGISFALAMLTREAVGVFAVVYTAAALFRPISAAAWPARLAANWRGAALLGGVATLPLLLYKIWLLRVLGSLGVPPGDVYLRIPFGGLIDLWPLNAEQIAAVELVTVPGLLIGGLGVWALGRRIWRVEIAALLVNVVLFVVLLSGDSYSYLHDAQRISTCVVLAASYSAPFTLPLGKRARLIFTACAAFWVVPLAYWLVRTW